MGATGDGEDGDASPESNYTFGAVYVFNVATGARIRKLQMVPPVHGSQFGYACAVSGSLAVATTQHPGMEMERAYRYDLATGEQLGELAPFDNPNLASDFGSAVAMSADYIAVSAPFESHAGGTGAVYVYAAPTGDPRSRLVADDAVPGTQLGKDVDVFGGRVLASATGAAYLFDLASGTQLKLVPSGGPVDDSFGLKVALSGSYALVSAPFDDEAGDDTGAVYFFDATTGAQVRKLLGTIPDVAFGSDLSISDGRVLIGGMALSDGRCFVHDLATGAKLDEFSHSNDGNLDFFGHSVAMSGANAVVGAPFWDSLAGAAYLFRGINGAPEVGGPPPAVQPSGSQPQIKKLSRQIKKLQKTIKKARKAGNRQKAASLGKKLRKLKKKLRALRQVLR